MERLLAVPTLIEQGLGGALSMKKALVAACVALAGAATASPQYTAVNIGAIAHPEAGDSSGVIAAAGHLVLGWSTPRDTAWPPSVFCVYDLDSGEARDLADGLTPFLLNASGDVLAVTVDANGNASGTAIVSAAGAVTALDLPADAQPWGLGTDGLILMNQPPAMPYLLGADGVKQPLEGSGATAIAQFRTDSGLVVGSSSAVLNGPSQPVIWQDGAALELGNLGHDGWDGFARTASPTTGLVAGAFSGYRWQRTVFLYGPDGMRDLGEPPGCEWACWPTAINDLGQMVGQSRDDAEYRAPHYHGWLWQEGAFTPLQPLVDLPNVNIESPLGIDELGRIPVNGSDDDWHHQYALVLVPVQ